MEKLQIKMNAKEEHQILLERWYEKYKDLETNDFNDIQFIWNDGPVNWDVWGQMPKILFLLKEAYDGGSPNDIPIPLNKFHLNIARWRYALKELYKNI